jgi:hypothetical protein
MILLGNTTKWYSGFRNVYVFFIHVCPGLLSLQPAAIRSGMPIKCIYIDYLKTMQWAVLSLGLQQRFFFEKVFSFSNHITI